MRKPTSRLLNDLYAAYLADATKQGDLLTAVFEKAVWVLKDDDAAQDFVVGVWRALPVDFDLFSLWIRIRLRLYLARGYRAKALARETAMPADEIERLPLPRIAAETDLDSVRDPFLRTVAQRLLQGYPQDEIARSLGITPACLRKRLQRVRTRASRCAVPASSDTR